MSIALLSFSATVRKWLVLENNFKCSFEAEMCVACVNKIY